MWNSRGGWKKYQKLIVGEGGGGGGIVGGGWKKVNIFIARGRGGGF